MPSTPDPSRWIAIVNASAGHGRTRRLLPALRRALATRGIDVHVSSDVDDGTRLARVAFEQGEGVLACGGDGTVAAIAGVAADTGGAIGIVPTGAGNDFARHLGIDRRHPLAAPGLVSTGKIVSVDLARASVADGTSMWCTTVANTGFDADANRWANGVRVLTGTPLYVAAMVRTVALYRPQPVVVRVDDETWRGRAWLVAVGNTRYYAGGMMITPAAEINDGLVDVCIVGATSVSRFVGHFPSVFRGTHVGIDDVVTLRGRRVELASDGGDVPLELWASGERVGALPGTVDVVPGALRVLVPPGAPVTTR
ncbi:MAG: diacylglycerol kinase family protein [Acidimicrobiia bacterium]